MATIIPLQPVSNQSLSILLDGNRYELTVRDTGQVVIIDITRDDTVILQGSRIIAGEPVIPYRHLEAGNFTLLSSDGDLPSSSEFGVSQTFYYATQAEIEGFRGQS